MYPYVSVYVQKASMYMSTTPAPVVLVFLNINNAEYLVFVGDLAGIVRIVFKPFSRAATCLLCLKPFQKRTGPNAKNHRENGGP